MSSTSRWIQIKNFCRATALDILRDTTDALDSDHSSPTETSLGNLPADVLSVFKTLAEDVSGSFANSTPLQDTLSQRLDEEIQSTYKRFYDFVYSDLPFYWRQLYTDLSILKFCLLLTGLDETTTVSEDGDDQVTKMVATLDKALILAGGAGTERGRSAIEKMLKLLEEACKPEAAASFTSDGEPAAKRPRTQTSYRDSKAFSSRRIFNPKVEHPIKVFDQMSMDDFQTYMDQGYAAEKDGPLPCIIRGLTDHWPAMTARPWNKPSYLLAQTFNGRRLVPVEVGRSYVDDGWGQELITFRELLSRMEHDTPDSPSYLAQHELFTQLPRLRNDIPTPDLCHTSPPPHPLSPSMNKPELPLPLVNAWFGPAGTITPLHTDGYHNLLAQVVGAKYVRLYSPLDSEALCPRGEDDDGIDMHNTSTIDVGVAEGWDPPPAGEAAPDDIELAEFRGLRRWEAILEPGDVLYVPIGWWHYVRSLSISFSVSFWWNGDHAGEEQESL
jgi:lysine-specific demethylase 8